MSPNITLITLGVADVAKATAFYEQLGFKKSKRGERELLQIGRRRARVMESEAQREDAEAGAIWNGNGGICVAQNVASEAEVDAVMATAEAAGAHILKRAAKTFWGGYNGYFADPDGHLWEVAFNPHWGLDEDGLIELPE